MVLDSENNSTILNILPMDLVEYMFLFLTVEEMCQIHIVCKSWKKLISQISKCCQLIQEYKQQMK